MAAFLEELKGKPYQCVAIFAHAGVLISAGLHAGLYSWENAWSNLPDYGSYIIMMMIQVRASLTFTPKFAA